MNMKKPLVVAGIASVVSLGGVAGSGVVSAATDQSTNSQQSLADAIATKFHLNKSDVQSVIKQNRQQHEAERQQKYETKLEEAVKEGKLTSSQKSQILDKEKELKNYADSLKGKTPQERHKLMKAKLDELKAWAKQNNIPAQYLPHGRGGLRP